MVNNRSFMLEKWLKWLKWLIFVIRVVNLNAGRFLK